MAIRDRAIRLDPSKNLKRYLIFPDMLPGGKFDGYKTRDDASQLRGSFVVGQNVKFSGASLPATRDGYEVMGTETADTNPSTARLGI